MRAFDPNRSKLEASRLYVGPSGFPRKVQALCLGDGWVAGLHVAGKRLWLVVRTKLLFADPNASRRTHCREHQDLSICLVIIAPRVVMGANYHQAQWSRFFV